MKRYFILFTLSLVGALGYGIYLGFQSQDLSDIKGRSEDDRTKNPSSVPSLIEGAAKDRTKSVTITERQLNSWLADKLKARQEGLLADHVKIKGVWVRFDEEEGGSLLEESVDCNWDCLRLIWFNRSDAPFCEA